MNSKQLERTIRHILVALDASPHSLAALEAAADMAAHLNAELSGLFIEDINLLNLADLPFIKQVDPFSASLRPIDRQHISRQFRMHAIRARKALEQVANRTNVQWSFRVIRGYVTAEIMAAASEADLVILGKAGWSPTREKRLGSTAQKILSESPCLTLVLQQGVRLELRVMVLFDKSEDAHKALEVAVQVLQGKTGQLTVLLSVEDENVLQKIHAQIDTFLQEYDLKAHYYKLTDINAQRLASIVKREKIGVLLLPGSSHLLKEEPLQTLLKQVECSVLIVR
ncbi:MAG: universal stress protein [Candidatus Scalindua sp.]|nr:universal stress protein [Candidatus Scalindua sp.]